MAELLKSQRNELFDRIQSAGFDPREFRLEASPEGDAVITHVATDFWFSIQYTNQGYSVAYRPGTDTPMGRYGTGRWSTVVPDRFGIWLKNVRRESEAPDLWELLEGERALLSAPSGDVANSQFNEAERDLISRQLREIQGLIGATYQLQEEQRRQLDARFEHLAEAAQRLGRLDWRELFLGAVVGLGLEAILPTAAVREIILLAGQGLAHLFGAPLPELPA